MNVQDMYIKFLHIGLYKKFTNCKLKRNYLTETAFVVFCAYRQSSNYTKCMQMLIEPYVAIDVNFLHIQANLSIANILYSKHLVTADIISRNRSNLGQTPIANLLYSGQFYSGHSL